MLGSPRLASTACARTTGRPVPMRRAPTVPGRSAAAVCPMDAAGPARPYPPAARHLRTGLLARVENARAFPVHPPVRPDSACAAGMGTACALVRLIVL